MLSEIPCRYLSTLTLDSLGQSPAPRRKQVTVTAHSDDLLKTGGVGGCRGVGESGSPGPLGLGAGMIFFIRGGCSVWLFSSRSCH